jgi:hypothetical protein
MTEESISDHDAQGLAQRLQGLLDAVAEAAAERAARGESVFDADTMLVEEGEVRKHFVEFSGHMRNVTGVDLALIEFVARAGDPPSLLLNSGDKTADNWPVWRRVG